MSTRQSGRWRPRFAWLADCYLTGSSLGQQNQGAIWPFRAIKHIDLATPPRGRRLSGIAVTTALSIFLMPFKKRSKLNTVHRTR